MQVNNLAEAAPELARKGEKNSGFCMQNHAAQACMVIFCEIAGFLGIFTRIFCGSAALVFAGQSGTVRVNIFPDSLSGRLCLA
jgi:hypothetical protein